MIGLEKCCVLSLFLAGGRSFFFPTAIFKKLILFTGDKDCHGSLFSPFFLSIFSELFASDRLFICVCNAAVYSPTVWWFLAVQKTIALGFVIVRHGVYFLNTLSCLFPELCVCTWEGVGKIGLSYLVGFSSCDSSIYLPLGQVSLRAGAVRNCLEAGNLMPTATNYKTKLRSYVYNILFSRH